MGINLKTLLNRDGLFMRCLVTALALAWVYILASDFLPPHIAPFRHGLHWLLAVGTSFQAVMGWVGPCRNPDETSDLRELPADRPDEAMGR